MEAVKDVLLNNAKYTNIGDNYEKRICTLQSNEVRFRCKNSDSKNWQSLQVQHQLPHYLDSEVSEKSLNWEGGICA